MNPEDDHGGITIGAMGILNRNAQISKMINDVNTKGRESKYHGWYQSYMAAFAEIHKQKVDKYNKLPKWLKIFFKNPNK